MININYNLFNKNEFLSFTKKQKNVYIDNEIFSCKEYKKNNIAYILESKAISNEVYTKFIGNIDLILNNFDYILTHDNSMLKLHEKILWAPASYTWIENPKIMKKNKTLSMISSSKMMCSGHYKRIEWLKKMIGKADIYGRDINPIEKKEQGLNDYMFSIAIENDQYSGYFTEKIIDCFATGTVPVYLGDPSIGEIFNTDGIIVLNESFNPKELNYELYKNMLPAIEDNFERSKIFFNTDIFLQQNYFKWKL